MSNMLSLKQLSCCHIHSDTRVGLCCSSQNIARIGSRNRISTWLDVVCIDQRRTRTGEKTREGKAETGRQARISRGVKVAYVWLSRTPSEKLLQISQALRESVRDTWAEDWLRSIRDAERFGN